MQPLFCLKLWEKMNKCPINYYQIASENISTDGNVVLVLREAKPLIFTRQVRTNDGEENYVRLHFTI